MPINNYMTITVTASVLKRVIIIRLKLQLTIFHQELQLIRLWRGWYELGPRASLTVTPANGPQVAPLRNNICLSWHHCRNYK